MIYNALGQTGIQVSKLCFGGLTIGPLQKNLSIKEGAKVIRRAFDGGVNFIDTAEMYQTYDHIKEGLHGLNRSDYVIASKSYAYDKKGAEKAVYDALKALNTDYLDVFLMHEQESVHTIRGHYEALETYLRLKEKGIIRSVGLSTHHVSGVEAAIKYKEIEVIHPILNISGLGIVDGTREEMYEKIRVFKKQGGGVFSMKPLGGGNLLNRVEDSFDYILKLDSLDAIAVGMQSLEEVAYNLARFENQPIDTLIKEKLKNQKRALHIAEWCTGCNACVLRCHQNALRINAGKAVVDHNKCVLCGYCSTVCKDFCIKVV
jgi:predicted aldo/keto reductase-like oxidoreductase